MGATIGALVEMLLSYKTVDLFINFIFCNFVLLKDEEKGTWTKGG
jgi:hypothetical protein